MRAFAKVLGLAVGLSIVAGAAVASTTTFVPPVCSEDDVRTLQSTDPEVWVASQGCIGPISASTDTVDMVNSGTYFGFDTWVKDSRYNIGTSGNWDPQGILTFDPAQNEGGYGTWGVTSWAGVEQAMIVLKGATTFAAYWLNISAGSSGDWTTISLYTKSGNQPNLSHITLYVVPAAIPLPASGLLLLGGLAGFGLVRRKRAALA